MRLLAISQFFPYPPVNGGKMRAYQLVRGMAKSHSVHLLTLSDSESDMEHIGHLNSFCQEVHVARAKPFRPTAPKALLGLLSPIPRSYVSAWSAEMKALVYAQLTTNKFDAAVAFGLGNARYLAQYSHIPRVVDDDNCDSVYAARLASEAPSSLTRARRKLTWAKSWMFERTLASKFDAAFVVSEEDGRELAAIAPSLEARKAIHVVPNGADLALLDFRGPEIDEHTIITPGALTYSANYDAARYLCENIFPLIKAEAPETRLLITGGTTGVDLGPFQGLQDVVLTGYLDDVRPAVAGSAAVVVPTRIGGGTRLKILEAMALGTPVVSTSFGAMGLGAKDGENILIGDTPEQFAGHVCAVMRNKELRSRISANGRNFVAERFGWDSIVDTMNRVIESVAKSSGEAV